jgi:hypothetical protein
MNTAKPMSENKDMLTDADVAAAIRRIMPPEGVLPKNQYHARALARAWHCAGAALATPVQQPWRLNLVGLAAQFAAEAETWASAANGDDELDSLQKAIAAGAAAYVAAGGQ